MAFPKHADFVVIGAGIHGLSCAWRLAEKLTEAGENVEGRIVVLDKSGRQALPAEWCAITIFNPRCAN